MTTCGNLIAVKSMTSKVRVTNACSKTADGFGCVAMKPDEERTPNVSLTGKVKFLRCSVAGSCCGGCPESVCSLCAGDVATNTVQTKMKNNINY